MRRAGLVAALVALAAAPAVSAQEVELGQLSARLYYKLSGDLSDDLLARPEPFVGWNTVIGEGDADEPADDLLVAVTLTSLTGDGEFLEDRLELWIENEEGSILARRDVEGVLVPWQGSVSTPLWLSDAGCLGLLNIHARFRGEGRQAQLNLHCGE